MDFKRATEELMAGMTRGEIADALGVSEATVRQARLDEAANAHRKPPAGWEAKVAKLAKQKSERLARLADRLAGGN
jgi:orotate phosphoribosyltransferase-like protein